MQAIIFSNTKLTEPMVEHEIRMRAYEIYEGRGEYRRSRAGRLAAGPSGRAATLARILKVRTVLGLSANVSPGDVRVQKRCSSLSAVRKGSAAQKEVRVFATGRDHAGANLI
jgi:hypothetical protein